MRNNFSKFAFTASVVLAMAFSFSCSGGDDPAEGDGGGGSGSGSCSLNGKTVIIDGQVWMAENLNCNVSGSRCYEDKESNCDKYGRLYNWATAKTVCPKGWHLPSDAEWTTLTAFVGEPTATKLKATSGWYGDSNGTDDYGFSALPGGHGYSGGSFDYVGNDGYWWSATEYNASYAWFRSMYRGIYDSGAKVYRAYGDKTYLYSVRCLQD